ncbi:sushi domain-containing protein 4 isoform 7-T8 [Molossus nigricans]
MAGGQGLGPGPRRGLSLATLQQGIWEPGQGHCRGIWTVPIYCGGHRHRLGTAIPFGKYFAHKYLGFVYWVVCHIIACIINRTAQFYLLNRHTLRCTTHLFDEVLVRPRGSGACSEYSGSRAHRGGASLGQPPGWGWVQKQVSKGCGLPDPSLCEGFAQGERVVLKPLFSPTAQVCPLPPVVSHGDFICHPRPCDRYNHGTVVEFYCDPGYSLTSDYKYITCQYGEWFPSYQVYCIKSAEQTWPNTHETLLTTWKIVAFTATSVLLVLLLVILARMFQTKFKAHFPPRGPPRSSSSDPDFVVVDGVPVMLPSYDEAVSGGLSALGPGYLASVGQGCPLPVDDQSPPAYPGSGDTDTGPGESETCDSVSGSSELLQSLYASPMCQGGTRPAPDNPDTVASTAGEVASTSPGIDIADEIPLMEEDP